MAKLQLLRFAASFLWADLHVGEDERTFLLELADELGIDEATARALAMRPPQPDDVDPFRVDAALADGIRSVALRAIAADGRVLPKEMEMFDLLDELLPIRARRPFSARADGDEP